MALKIDKIDIWSGEIQDRVGGLSTGLAPLVEAGASFSFLIARRQPEKPGSGIVFLSGLSGAKQMKAAALVGLAKSDDVAGLRVEAQDKPGVVHELSAKLASAGINLRGVSAAVIGAKCVVILAFEGAADRDKAAKVLAQMTRTGIRTLRSAE
jgi:predicted amino acid-binding ACT domain protein